jgi:hypothetical protein
VLGAARKAGPEGRVVATDISAEMLAFGCERSAAAGLDNLEFIESDASRLDFPPESFDATVSRWGIMPGCIRGFLKSGARMGIASWREPASAISAPGLQGCPWGLIGLMEFAGGTGTERDSDSEGRQSERGMLC